MVEVEKVTWVDDGIYRVDFKAESTPINAFIHVSANSELGAAARFMYERDKLVTVTERHANGWLNLHSSDTVEDLIRSEISFIGGNPDETL